MTRISPRPCSAAWPTSLVTAVVTRCTTGLRAIDTGLPTISETSTAIR